MAAKFEVSSNGRGGFKWILSSQGRTLAHQRALQPQGVLPERH